MIQLHVTPDEYMAIQSIADRASMTIDGDVNVGEWIKGIRFVFGDDLVEQLLPHRTIQVVVEYNGQVLPRITDSELIRQEEQEQNDET